MNRPRLRCAIYTRKSSEEGLDQDFNSLDAQRESCSAYVCSQAGEGWSVVKTRYDDGGVSGGTLDRPGLQQLLADIGAGKIDIVVVYKVDRLTRSLTDFARIVETFDARGVSFVSVTQPFNTTTSMGRLTLNVLLSFAQFEREVTAERIRDKIAASKRKGLWMGGVVPLGYDAIDRKLVINEGEATTVRRLFDLYLQHGTVQRVCEEARHLGLHTKPRAHKDRGRQGGVLFQRGHLYKLLSNPIYVGEIAHKEERYPGEQPAIVDRAAWEAVQGQFAHHAVIRRHHHNGRNTSLLAGLLFDTEGHRLTPTHACKQGRRYRYYASPKEGDRIRWRLPAVSIETTVCDAIVELLRDGRRLMNEVLPASLAAADLKAMLSWAEDLGGWLHEAGPIGRRDLFLDLVEHIEVAKDRLRISVRVDRLLARVGGDTSQGAARAGAPIPPTSIVVIDQLFALRRRGRGTRIVIAGSERAAGADDKLIFLITQAHRWISEFRGGRAVSVRDLARRHGVDRGDVSRVLPLAFLAPDIVEAILAGRQPAGLTVTTLRRGPELPHSWVEQRRLLGFA